jgi:hypothetical protein
VQFLRRHRQAPRLVREAYLLVQMLGGALLDSEERVVDDGGRLVPR